MSLFLDEDLVYLPCTYFDYGSYPTCINKVDREDEGIHNNDFGSNYIDLLKHKMSNYEFTHITPLKSSRRVAQFGYSYGYGKSEISIAKPIPPELDFVNLYNHIRESRFKRVIDAVIGENMVPPSKLPNKALSDFEDILSLNKLSTPDIFTQVIVNEYLPGQKISPHVDSPIFGPIIIALSLGQSGKIHFEECNSSNGTRKAQSFDLEVKEGSIYILRNSARYKWKHSFHNKKNTKQSSVSDKTRYSITYRTLAQ